MIQTFGQFSKNSTTQAKLGLVRYGPILADFDKKKNTEAGCTHEGRKRRHKGSNKWVHKSYGANGAELMMKG